MLGFNSLAARSGIHHTRTLASAAFAASIALLVAGCGEDPKKKSETAGQAQAQTTAPAGLLTPGPLGDKILGKADAPVTIVEYASLTCIHCANFHNDTLPALKEKFIETGKVRLIFREFPFDPLSTAASMLARCAPEPRYFPLVELFFKTQQAWAASEKPLDEMLGIARQAGFTQESFDACLKNQSVYDGLNAQRKAGSDTFGVSSTPTFFINGEKKSGNLSIAEMEKAIEPHLKK